MAQEREREAIAVARPPLPAFRLAKALGVLAIAASALSHEYGATINFAATNSLGVYPGVQGLVPWAMFAAGIVLIPKLFLYMRFSEVMPRAGSTYVWVSRSLSLPLGFVLNFLQWAGLTAAIGFIGFVFGTFLGQALIDAGFPAGRVLLTPLGHVVLGAVMIWGFYALHVAGVELYGRVVVALAGLITVVALLIIGYGFATAPATFVHLAAARSGLTLAAPDHPAAPTFGAFVSVTFLFIAAYGGLNGAPALGGEARDASRTVPRGLFLGWLSALVLYTAVAAALFHAVPWWATLGLIRGKALGLATAPGLIGVIAPAAVATILNFLVAIIVAKTAIPQMLVASRFIFACAEDRILPPTFLHTSRRKAPDRAVFLTAALATLFLVQSALVGWAIGIAIRALTVLVMEAVVAIGALNVMFNARFLGVPWADRLRRGPWVVVLSILAIAVALVLLWGGAVVPHTPFLLQPIVQSLIAAAVAAFIFVRARPRLAQAGMTLPHLAAELPLE
ncbi:MAG: APC family permease [Rhodospirillales bacterium]|nr:APC family permease [Rhodospirillales bacterium]